MTLTREQVEWICSGSSAVKETLKQLADTDAALRQELADLQDQARQRRLTPDGYCSYCAAYAAGWLTECTNPIHTDGLPRLVELRQELEDVPTLRGDLGMLMTQLKERDSIIDQLRQQLSEVRTELASYAWTVTPAMVQATLDQLNQQLAALQLHWSTKKPTVSGQYWWRSQESVNGQKFPKVCHVFENNKVLYVEGLGVGSFYLKNASGEWAGPLVPPEEATSA